MRKVVLAAVIAVTGFSSAALAEGKKIGVSWASFQEERWKIDEAAMKAAIEAAGDEYISADAQSSSEKQLSDVDALIAQGANALIINAWDKDAIGPVSYTHLDVYKRQPGHLSHLERPNFEFAQYLASRIPA